MIYIVRHGQTEGNKEKRMQGRSDLPLNEAGIRQAGEAGRWFLEKGIRLDSVYSSPLSRARDTAAAIAPYAEVETDDRLIEMDYGPYEGMDLTRPAPEVIHFFSDFVNHPAPEGMEPLSLVTARLGLLLEELRERAGKENILLSTHAIAMKGALEYLTPESKGSYWSKYIGNCSIYEVPVSGTEYGIPYEVWSADEQKLR